MTEQNQGIPVDGNLTPITKKPIQSVKANDWHKMTVTELYDQLSILHGRLVMASQLNNHSILQQLHVGVSQLQAYIDHKNQQAEDSKK